jgi:glycosyltransferase involved in cell wall biosynthesis
MPPLRIGIYFAFPAGGIGRYNRELVRALAELGDVDVEYACLPNYAWADDLPCRVWRGLFPISDRVPALRRARFLLGQWCNPRRALRHFHEAGVPLIHWTNIHHLSAPLWRGLLDRSGTAMVISAHDVCRGVAIVNRAYEDRQLAWVYRRADALLVHSEFQRDELVAFAGVDPQRVTVVPHGPYDYGDPLEGRTAVRQRCGIPADVPLGLAFGQIRESHLLIAGNAPARHRGALFYRELAASLGLADRVHFDVRHVPDDEVAGLVCAADWLALPYPSSFTSQSGVLNLAAHYERPVLVGSAPVLREGVNGYAIGEAAADDGQEALAAALQRLEHGLAQSKPPFAFDLFRAKHSWAENARRTRGVYQRVLEEKRQ